MQVPSERRPAYRRLCRLAEGGMGYVELAVRQEGRFRRVYALKRLQPHHRDDAAFRAMFMDEGRLAGLVRHPNVVSVHDVGEDDDGPFLVMDYVHGISLAAIIRDVEPRDAPLPVALCVTVAAQAARGLHAAHELQGEDGALLGLVHRDVSPQNILVGFDGTARVTDFGIAKALGNTNRTATGLLKGNLGYMSPEQLRFEEPDRRSDLFSLGVVLHEALARRRLYRNDDPRKVARRILSEPPPDIQEIRPDVPPEVVQLLFELLAKDRALRPESALVVAERLEALGSLLDAAEGRFDLATFLRVRLGAVDARLRDQVTAALARAQPAAASPARAPSRRKALLIPLGLGVALAGGAGAMAIRPPRPPVPPPTAAPRGTGARPDRTAAAEAPAGGAPPPESPAPAPAREPSPAAPRRVRRMRVAADPLAPESPPPQPQGGGALLKLPRRDTGARKLEVPIATDWQ